MSFIEDMLDAVETAGDRSLLVEIHGPREVALPARETFGEIRRVRAWLASQGVSPGDRVGLLAPNSARWAAVDLALLSFGAIVVPLYARQDVGELAGMLRDCGAVLTLAGDGALRDALAGALGEGARVHTFDEALSVDPAQDPGGREIAPSDVVTIIYTSGTSGEPKGVRLTRANVDFMLPTTVARLEEATGSTSPDDRVFHYLPLCFAGSRILLWTMLRRGNPLLLSTDLTNLVEEMGTARAQYFLNVPALLERIRRGVDANVAERGGPIAALYARAIRAGLADGGTSGLLDRAALALAERVVFPRIREKVGPALKFLICGSAPLGEATQRWFELLGIPVLQVYGLTETTAICTMDRPGRARAGYVGSAIDGVELRVDEDGELLVRGPHVFDGYWGRPEKTAEAMKGEWFRTGDQAELDAEGRLRVIGRVKNVLVPSSGHNVPPEPIEEALQEALPAAEHIVVLGHGRPHLVALVTGPVTDADIQAALDAVNPTLPHYRRVRAFHRSAEPLTPENGLLTANQKLRRTVIAAHFAPALDALYAGAQP
ncbi:MAG: hypothetical protein EA398_15110 [Deltaproteobacteria bacterium]|nr:MAG: hypothetical protein EA398_15110 [Deltaproteobacteria bacterium]